MSSPEREYIYHSPVHITYTRIDYFLIDKWLLQKVCNSDIAPITWADHAPTSITISNCASTPARNIWKANAQILKTSSYAESIQQRFQNFS